MQSVTFLPTTAPESAPSFVFLHANGYPPESYRQFLEPLCQQVRIGTVEHRPLWTPGPAPWALGWQAYADDVLSTLEHAHAAPVWLMGHSMGAVTAILAAARAPERVAGLIAIDPVMIPERVWLGAQVSKLMRRDMLPMIQRALTRPHEFQGYEAAFAFYREKRAFKHFSDAALWDYVHAGHVAVPGQGVRLRWTGAWEACVYRSAPLIWRKLARLRQPILGIAGRESDVLPEAIRARWQRAQPHLELEVLNAGHLVPMERPDECAAQVLAFLDRHSVLISH